MSGQFASRFANLVIRKAINAELKLMRGIVNAQSRLPVGHDCPEFRIPICASTGFNNSSWRKSWKTHLIQRLFSVSNGTFIDAGANSGQTLLDLLATHPEAVYLGFEPNIACAFYVKELIRANTFKRCRIVPAGLTDETRCLSLYRRKDDLGDQAASVIPFISWAFEVDDIACFKFDEIRHGLGIKDIGFVKIDIEGAELEAVRGMTKSLEECRPVMLCEVLFTDNHADLAAHKVRNDQLLEVLRTLNYEVAQLVKSNDDAKVVDALKVRSFPSAFYSDSNKNLCDYLFIPKEKETNTLSALLSTA